MISSVINFLHLKQKIHASGEAGFQILGIAGGKMLRAQGIVASCNEIK